MVKEPTPFNTLDSVSLLRLRKLCAELIEEDTSGKELAFRGTYLRSDKEIGLYFESDTECFEENLALGVTCLENLSCYEEQAQMAICDRYLAIYNENWKDHDKPFLTRDQFVANLLLVRIEFYEATNICLDFEDNEMFAGHQITSASLDGGITFTVAEMQ